MEPQDGADAAPERMGVADLHGCLATVCGLVTLCFAAWCCGGGRLGEDPRLLVFMAVVAGTLWSGLFALTAPGSTTARIGAAVGLGLLVLGLGLGMFASCLGVIDPL